MSAAAANKNNILNFIISNNLQDLLIDKVLPYLPTSDIVKFRLLNKQWNSDLTVSNSTGCTYDEFWRDLTLVRDKLVPIASASGKEELATLKDQLFSSLGVSNWYQCYRHCSTL